MKRLVRSRTVKAAIIIRGKKNKHVFNSKKNQNSDILSTINYVADWFSNPGKSPPLFFLFFFFFYVMEFLLLVSVSFLSPLM